MYRLEVKVKGKPKPKVKWYKQGTEIVSSQEFQIEEFEDGTSVLTIAETFPDDTGEIVFEAHNPLGVSTTMTYLSVEGNIILKIQFVRIFLIYLVKFFSATLFDRRSVIKILSLIKSADYPEKNIFLIHTKQTLATSSTHTIFSIVCLHFAYLYFYESL